MANKNIQIQDVNGNNLYPVSLIKVTYAELKSLRDKSNLMPGMQYRITDYQCTTTQKDTQSAAHQFDIIVTADSTNKLNEVARAIQHEQLVHEQHEGDEYFSNCNLAAWKIWYCLDNDTNRFAWADATNGKGVVYRMIDEFNNDCPYDFKNIMFKRYYSANAKDKYGYDYISLGKHKEDDDSEYGSITGTDITKSKYLYTFSSYDDNGNISDASIGAKVHINTIGNTYASVNIDDDKYYDNQNLNNIVLLFENSNVENFDYAAIGGENKFDANCRNITLVNCAHNTFGTNCNNIIFGDRCVGNIISPYSSDINFEEENFHNFIGMKCQCIHLAGLCCNNNFENCRFINDKYALVENCTLHGGYDITFGNEDSNTYTYTCITVLPFIFQNETTIDLSRYVKYTKITDTDSDEYVYPQFVGMNTSGNIVSYTLDSIINNS